MIIIIIIIIIKPYCCRVVEEFNYTTLSIVFSTPSSGRGRTRIGFSLLDREIRVSFDLEYLGRRTSYCEKIAVQKFTIEFYAWLISSSATVRRSAARGPKRKNFSPKFIENEPTDRRHFGAVHSAYEADKNAGILVS